MSEFDKILAITNSEDIKFGLNIPNELKNWLVLGQTEWVCKYGTLSDGHEKITDAQKYAQALKEVYFLSLNINSQKSQAKIAQAEMLDAIDDKENAATESQHLRAEAKYEMAYQTMLACVITVEDQSRMVKAYMIVINELKKTVPMQYDSLEHSEKDNWEAVYKYRMFCDSTPGMPRHQTNNVPLPMDMKAKLGHEFNRNDSIAPLAVSDSKKALELKKTLLDFKTRG